MVCVNLGRALAGWTWHGASMEVRSAARVCAGAEAGGMPRLNSGLATGKDQGRCPALPVTTLAVGESECQV